MKKQTIIDYYLIHARPDTAQGDQCFTDAVMNRIGALHPEINIPASRKMRAITKELFMNRFKTLPTFAVIAIIAVAVVALSGGVYAAYKLLWNPPETRIIDTNVTERGQDEYIISFDQCGNAEGLERRYEVKRGESITPEQAQKIAKADCEIAQIYAWAHATYAKDSVQPGTQTAGVSYPSVSVSVSIPAPIQTILQDEIRLSGDVDSTPGSARTVSLPQDALIIKNGQQIPRNEATSGTLAVYVTVEDQTMTPMEGCNSKHCSIQPKLERTRNVALVLLSMPAEYYQTSWAAKLIERHTCHGNETELCASVGGIPLYGNHFSANQKHAIAEKGTYRVVQGTIVSTDDRVIVLKATSGKLFTVHGAPYDIVAEYNTAGRAAYGSSAPFAKAGMTLDVTYFDTNMSDDSTIINYSDLFQIIIGMEGISRTDYGQPY